ncbi:MAG: hypothetical protein IT454_00305 [Planctomycetes bacterium]|nr:hypothetical protein [Planctomycetota bacterium]
MADAIPIQPKLAQVGGPRAAQGAAGVKKGAEGGGDALAFKALLDQLEQRAQALELESKKNLTKDDLVGAIDEARTSLEQMLSLKDQLLEAWRASKAQPAAIEKT